MPFFKGADQGEGGKSFFKPKMTKVITFLGGQGGEFFFFFFLKIYSIYDFFLIGPLNKSFLETLQKWQKCKKCCFWHFKWDYPLNMPLSKLGLGHQPIKEEVSFEMAKFFFCLNHLIIPWNLLKKKKKSWIRPSNTRPPPKKKYGLWANILPYS